MVNSIQKNIQDWIEQCEVNPPDPTTGCRECGKVANFISKRDGCVRTQFGLIRYQRARYLCPYCHHTTCPLDERLNPVESLARLRSKILAGEDLPVGKLAKTWGLGSLDILNEHKVSPERSRSESPPAGSDIETNLFGSNRHQFIPILCKPILEV